jgi:plastocyanin
VGERGDTVPYDIIRLGLAIALAGAAAPRPPARAEIRLFRYDPDTLEVQVGTRVVWINRDETAHTVTAGEPDSARGRPARDFDLPLASRGDSVAHLFHRVGEHTYHCARHPFMRGIVRVVP